MEHSDTRSYVSGKNVVAGDTVGVEYMEHSETKSYIAISQQHPRGNRSSTLQ